MSRRENAPTDVTALCACGHAWGHHMGTSDGSCTSASGCDCPRFVPDLLDALARSWGAAREPRTGEGT